MSALVAIHAMSSFCFENVTVVLVTAMACARCDEWYSGRDCGFTAAEAQARSAMQDMLLERISNLTMAANGSGGGSSTSVRLLRPAKCDWQGRSDWIAREVFKFATSACLMG